MLSPVLLAKCLAVGWVPIAWSLFQTSATAKLSPVSVDTKFEHSKKAAAANLGELSFDTSVRQEQARSRTSEATPLSDALPTNADSLTAAVTPSAERNTTDAIKAAHPPLTSINPLGDEKLEEKPSTSIAPQLEAFFGQAATAAPTAIAGFSPERSLAQSLPQSEENSQPEENRPDSEEVLPSAPRDPELGVIQVADPRRDPELGLLQLRNPLQDPELGILELRQFSPPPPPRPWLFVSTYISASSSDNVFLVQDPIQGRFGDNFIRPGISIIAFPALGPQTNLLASVETNLLRYDEQSASNYDEIRVRAAIRHGFTDRVYGQIGFSSQLLFEEGYDDQFFTSNGVEVTVGRRDPLTPQLTLDTFYRGQVFFSDPSEFSNVLNSVGASLNYRFAPRWDTGVSYRFTISDFTRQSRREAYQRITGQLRYAITPSVRVSVFGGLSYGRSSEERINFDDSFFGISFDATIQVF